MIPSLGLINLLERLTELRKTVYFLHHPFIMKGCNSGAARQRCARQRGVSTFSPGRLTLPTSARVHPSSSPNPILSVFMAASLRRHGWPKHWSLVTDSISSPSPFPGVHEQTASSNPPAPWSVPLASSPHPGVTQGLSKSHLINVTKTPLSLSSLGNCKGFRSTVPQLSEEQIDFSYYKALVTALCLQGSPPLCSWGRGQALSGRSQYPGSRGLGGHPVLPSTSDHPSAAEPGRRPLCSGPSSSGSRRHHLPPSLPKLFLCCLQPGVELA